MVICRASFPNGLHQDGASRAVGFTFGRPAACLVVKSRKAYADPASDDARQTSGWSAPFMFAGSIATVPEVVIICDPAAGAPQLIGRPYSGFGVPGARRALTNTTLVPCQASVASAGNIDG